MSTHDNVNVCSAVDQTKEWLARTKPVYIEFRLASADFRRAKPQNPAAEEFEKVMRQGIDHTDESYASALEALFQDGVPGYKTDMWFNADNGNDCHVSLKLVP